MFRILTLCAGLVLSLQVSSSSANDWTRFRGADGAGVAAEQTIPAEVGPEKNVKWKISVPAGTSSPIIVGDKLLLTSHADDQRTLHCFNALTGAAIWEKSIGKTRRDCDGTRWTFDADASQRWRGRLCIFS